MNMPLHSLLRSKKCSPAKCAGWVDAICEVRDATLLSMLKPRLP